MNETIMSQRKESIMKQQKVKDASLEKVKRDLEFKSQMQQELAAIKREEKEESLSRLARQEEYKRNKIMAKIKADS